MEEVIYGANEEPNFIRTLEVEGGPMARHHREAPAEDIYHTCFAPECTKTRFPILGTALGGQGNHFKGRRA